jgi:hypothetical protein
MKQKKLKQCKMPLPRFCTFIEENSLEENIYCFKLFVFYRNSFPMSPESFENGNKKIAANPQGIILYL